MKNLRKNNPTLSELKKELKAPVESWAGLNKDQRIDLCVRFLLMPMLEKKQELSTEMRDTLMSSAVDIEHQASVLFQQDKGAFVTTQHLIEFTVSLFLQPE